MEKLVAIALILLFVWLAVKAARFAMRLLFLTIIILLIVAAYFVFVR